LPYPETSGQKGQEGRLEMRTDQLSSQEAEKQVKTSKENQAPEEVKL
jgi:hypothetical protein